MSEPEERLYFLDPVARNIELFLCSDGAIATHGIGLTCSPEIARAVAMGLLALCSGQFDRAVSEETYHFLLAVRAARKARAQGREPSRRESTADHTPQLGDL